MDENPEPIIAIFLLIALQRYHKKGVEKSKTELSQVAYKVDKITPGLQYTLDFENEKRDYDKEFESNGLTIVCDLKSWLYLKDVEIDYSDDLLNGGFKIKNPNAERTCGCGTSFSA